MMKLKFANDFNEYAEGQLYFKNDGSPIEVDNVLGRQLLFAKAWLGGEMVTVFAEELASDFPEDFPAIGILLEAGYTFDLVSKLTREQLIDIKGIGEKTADAILSFIKEKK